MADQTNDTNFGDGIFKIPEQNMKKFEAAIAKLSKKSIKLNGESITPIVFGYELVTDKKGFAYKAYDVMLGGTAPKINGWVFIAKIDHTHDDLGNLVRALPGQIIPEKFRSTGCVCEHCNINRFRRDTFLLKNETTNEIVQVGRTCLKDFLGHDSPENIAKLAELLGFVRTIVQGFTNEQGIDRKYVGLMTYLTYVACAVREHGWFVSQKVANEHDIPPTKTVALNAMMGTFGECNTPTDADRLMAENSIKWAKSLGSDGVQINDYEHNIKVISNSDAIEFRSIGYAASIVGAYIRISAARAEPKEQKAPSVYVGSIGEKISVVSTLKRIVQTSGQFGYGFMYLFEDSAGAMLKWFTSKDIVANIGDTFTCECKVKIHDEYKGVKYTTVTHCKFKD